MNARTLIAASLLDLNVYAPGEPIAAVDCQIGLAAANRMVSAWRAQSLTTIATYRQIFRLRAGQQTYSVGLGGDFNVPRPQAVTYAGLLLNGLTAAVSVTIARVADVATVTQTAHGRSVGDQVIIDGCTQPAYNGIQTVATVPTANSLTFAVFGLPSTPATGAPTASAFAANGITIPRTVLTRDAWDAIQLKTMPSGQFTGVYYNPTQPLGAISLWPVPNVTTNQLVLDLQQQFEGFADLSTDYTFPDLPGYGEALQYNLGLRLAIPYAKEPAPDLRELARTSLGLVKRQNYQLSDLPTDPALTMSQRGGYNINTGTGG